MKAESAMSEESLPKKIVDGEIPTNGVSMVYGEPGTGKTTLALTLLVDTVVETSSDVLFIDTEGVSMKRFKQIIDERTPDNINTIEVLDQVRMRQVTDYDSQVDAVRDAIKDAKNTELIVIDSLTARYRVKYGTVTEPEDRQRLFEQLRGQVLALTAVARKHNTPVFVTNQVTTDPETGTVQPVGGRRLIGWVDTLLRLSQTGNTRSFDNISIDSLRVKDRIDIQITDAGVTGIRGKRFAFHHGDESDSQ